ncbi:MAG: PepSY-like domain-containing protein [Bacteroidales bacterium]|nr:PepSY-like domain-containing protein [Bacteroidales bacterium]
MKKLILIATLLSSVLFFSCAKDKKTSISFEQLPVAAQTFLNTHFADLTLQSIIKEEEGKDVEYDVKYTDFTEVNFDRNGDWEKVERRGVAVPDGIIPEAVLAYVKANYAQSFIVEIDKDRNGYEVKLNGGLDLEFDRNGNFKRLD